MASLNLQTSSLSRKDVIIWKVFTAAASHHLPGAPNSYSLEHNDIIESEEENHAVQIGGWDCVGEADSEQEAGKKSRVLFAARKGGLSCRQERSLPGRHSVIRGIRRHLFWTKRPEPKAWGDISDHRATCPWRWIIILTVSPLSAIDASLFTYLDRHSMYWLSWQSYRFGFHSSNFSAV